MVLQRDEQIVFSGNCSPNQAVQLRFNEKNFQSTSDESGKWSLILPPHLAGGPFDLVFSSGNEKIELTNVLFGDVWIASGQSNMNMPMAGWGRVANYEDEIANARYPEIRLLTIPLTLAESPRNSVITDGWQTCTPENIGGFSATAYFFARELAIRTGIPIGVIHVSKGGTPIEAWMCSEALQDYDYLQEKIEFIANGSPEKFKQINDDYRRERKLWYSHTKDIDPGFSENVKWFSNDYDFSSWRKVYTPQVWENVIGNFDGIVWYKKIVNLPKSWEGADLTLDLGPVQDYDITYFNGTQVGEQLKRDNLSVYSVPKNLVKAGKNVITVRVLDMYGNGGLWGRFDNFEIRKDELHRILLKGEWHLKPALKLGELDRKPPQSPKLDRYPTVLFNGMISPLLETKAAGVIWYQGESNSGKAFEYRETFKRMITHWRGHFNNPSMPFFFVQLASYKTRELSPDPYAAWGVLRESQAEALELPNTGMATAIDIGDDTDVHPKNKQEVGRRLALCALNSVYGFNVESTGPLFREMKTEGNKIRLYFDHAEGLQTTDRLPPREFIISDNDGKFFIAETAIEKSTILVWSDEVKQPKAVRYAWQYNPDVNLINSAGLPALPFRTDKPKN